MGIHSTKMFYILISIVVISSLYFILPGVTIAQENPKTFLTHTGLVIKTTGDVIDPIGYNGESLDFDPDKFMKDFDYYLVDSNPKKQGKSLNDKIIENQTNQKIKEMGKLQSKARVVETVGGGVGVRSTGSAPDPSRRRLVLEFVQLAASTPLPHRFDNHAFSESCPGCGVEKYFLRET